MKKMFSLASMGLAALVAIGGSAYAASTSSSSTSSGQSAAAVQQDQGMAGHHHVGHKVGYKNIAGFQNKELLTLLQVDNAASLKKELKGGKSLADIAADHNISEQKVIDLLMSKIQQHLDQAVKSGKLKQEKADQIQSKLQEQLKKKVEHKGGFDFGWSKHYVQNDTVKKAAAALGMKPQDVLSELKAGKTLAQIAQEKNIGEQQLVDKLLEKEKEHLTKTVEKVWQKRSKTDKPEQQPGQDSEQTAAN